MPFRRAPYRLVFLLLGALFASSHALSLPAAEKPLSRIMFGSCIQQDHPQPIWDSVIAAKPGVFVLLGDNIYGDNRDVEVLRKKYAQLGDQPGFKKLRATCPLLAVWDDHDYGENDAGVEYPSKVASQKVFNDFFNVPKDSPRRKRAGIYAAQTYGPTGKRVQIILLDTRYFRSALRKWERNERPKGRGPYRPHEDSNEEVTVLGEAQWQWLEAQLQQPAELRVIASSIQVIPAEHGWEMWANFPRERQRLFDTIAKAKAAGVIFISGDRHHGEISRIDSKDSRVSYPLFDVTSSSLNRPSSGANRGEPNRFRLGENYPPINFGSIVIDWERDDPAIELAIRDGDGRVVRSQSVSRDALRAR